MKRIATLALLCALVFGILASWLGPKMIAYWYAPPVPSALAGACTESVTWAMARLVWTQVIGAAVGAVLGVVAGLLFGRRKAAPPAVPAPPKAK